MPNYTKCAMEIDILYFFCSKTAFFIYTIAAFVTQYFFFLVFDYYFHEMTPGRSFNSSTRSLSSLIIRNFQEVWFGSDGPPTIEVTTVLTLDEL